MECLVCKQGVMGKGQEDIILEKGSAVIIVHGLPATVCSHCGHYELAKDVQEELDKRIREILQQEAHLKLFGMRKGEA